MNLIINVFLSIVLGFIGAWSAIRIGGSYGLMDHPGYRSSHTRPTPKGGGIGILIAFTAVSLLNNIPTTLWLPVVIISLTGLIGDRVDLSQAGRLVVQFACALIVILGGSHHVGPAIFSQFLAAGIGVLFLSGTANVYNFMDGINGIAGITAIVGFSLLAIYGYMTGIPGKYITLSLCITFACIGFLPFNLPTARVFMGDTGSVLLGFLFAAMVWETNSTLLGMLSCTAFIFLIYADAMTTIAIRFVQGDKILVPHRRHLYQLLVNEFGMPHWQVSVGYGVVQLLIGLLILRLQKSGLLAVTTGLFILGLIFIAASVAIHQKGDRLHSSGPCDQNEE